MKTSVKKVSQELTARQAGFSRVTNSANKIFEDILMKESPDEYMENGVRNWLKIPQDVVVITKDFKSGALPSLEMVMSIVEKKYQDPLRLIEQRSKARKRPAALFYGWRVAGDGWRVMGGRRRVTGDRWR